MSRRGIVVVIFGAIVLIGVVSYFVFFMGNGGIIPPPELTCYTCEDNVLISEIKEGDACPSGWYEFEDIPDNYCDFSIFMNQISDPPETGPFDVVEVSGTVTLGSGINRVDLYWHDNIEYGRTYDSIITGGEWSMHALIQRMGAGKHPLTAVAKIGNTIVSEVHTEVTIPEKWVYEHDSDSPYMDDAVYTDDGYYGFEMPYRGTADLSDYFLTGDITKVKGQVHVVTSDGVPHDVYLNIWNGDIGEWTTATILSLGPDGWYDVDVVVNEYGTAIGFSGYDYDTVDGFIGEVWIEPGTTDYDGSPFEGLFILFNRGDINNPPRPK